MQPPPGLAACSGVLRKHTPVSVSQQVVTADVLLPGWREVSNFCIVVVCCMCELTLCELTLSSCAHAAFDWLSLDYVRASLPPSAVAYAYTMKDAKVHLEKGLVCGQ